MMQNSGLTQDNINKLNKKWVCLSCEFGNRPLRYECMLCHIKKQIATNLITISDQQKTAAMKSADIKHSKLVKKSIIITR